MKFIAAFFRMILGPPLVSLTQALHVRLLNAWLAKPNTTFLHPQCRWILADGHPNQGTYVGQDFCDWYRSQLADTYWKWNEVIHEIIGSSIGGIVVGEYLFQYELNGPWYTAPFTRFYQIRRGQITDVRHFMGKVTRCETTHQPIELSALLHFCSPN